MLAKVELKSILITPGVQCVIMAGIQLMQKWYADNWDYRMAMHNLLEHLCLDKEQVRYGCPTYLVEIQTVFWMNVSAVVIHGVGTCVIIARTPVLFAQMVMVKLSHIKN